MAWAAAMVGVAEARALVAAEERWERRGICQGIWHGDKEGQCGTLGLAGVALDGTPGS